MKQGIWALTLILATFSAGAEERTAFDILPGWLRYPGLNAQAEVGYEYALNRDFYKGLSTEFLTLKDAVGVRYGFVQGVTSGWASHQFGFSINRASLEQSGIKIKLPPFMDQAGVHFWMGVPSAGTGQGRLTAGVGLVLLRGSI